MQSPAELGHAVAADRILLVDPKHPVLVGVERHRFAMPLQISPGRCKIVEGALALDKLQMHQPAGGVVNVDEQGALRPTSLEPPVLRSVDLDQLAHAVPAIPRLVHRPQPGAAILPQTRRDHPLPDRLTGKVNVMKLRKLLCCQGRAKVRVTLPEDANHFGMQSRREPNACGPSWPYAFASRNT